MSGCITFAAVAICCAGASAPRETEQRATAWLQAWDGQDTHRTATAGDEAGATWLQREATKIAGARNVTSETFRLERIDPIAAYVEFDGVRIDGEPLFDGASTAPGGIRGVAASVSEWATNHSLTLAATGAPIAVLELPPGAVYGPDFKRMRRESTDRAQVIITMGNSPGLALLNAEMFRSPVGPPAVQVSSLEHDRIIDALRRKVEFHVVVDFKRTPAEARNVVVTIPGRDRARPPLVVMTPRSSWWQSTAERGGGIVCWLETLRALQAAPPSCDVVLTANSGHELGHVGLDAFIARRPGWEKTCTWIHYGANIGAAGSKLQIQSNQDDLRTLTMERLMATGQRTYTLADKTIVPTGETRDIHLGGGRYVTVFAPHGVSPVFHLPQDRWPEAVDVPTIARVAEAMAGVVVALTR